MRRWRWKSLKQLFFASPEETNTIIKIHFFSPELNIFISSTTTTAAQHFLFSLWCSCCIRCNFGLVMDKQQHFLHHEDSIFRLFIISLAADRKTAAITPAIIINFILFRFVHKSTIPRDHSPQCTLPLSLSYTHTCTRTHAHIQQNMGENFSVAFDGMKAGRERKHQMPSNKWLKTNSKVNGYLCIYNSWFFPRTTRKED